MPATTAPSPSTKAERRLSDVGPKSERLNINVSARTAASLRRLSEIRETTVTDTVRRAVAVLELLEDEIAAGNALLVRDHDGNITQLAIV